MSKTYPDRNFFKGKYIKWEKSYSFVMNPNLQLVLFKTGYHISFNYHSDKLQYEQKDQISNGL